MLDLLKISAVLASLLFVVSSAHAVDSAGAPPPPPATAAYVDLEQYAGLWHQIAFIPNRFQKSCVIDTTAYYAFRPDGRVNVVNECTHESGQRRIARGLARVVDHSSQAKLKVRFAWFLPEGDYWILDVATDYRYALVGTPDYRYLWILGRDAQMGAAEYDRLVARAKELGYDVSRLQLTGTIARGAYSSRAQSSSKRASTAAQSSARHPRLDLALGY